MYNYQTYSAPQYTQSSNYYTPYSTISYQSQGNKPSYYESIGKSTNNYYKEEIISSRQTIVTHRDTYHGTINSAKKCIDFDVDVIRNKLNNLMMSRIDEQKLITDLFYEVQQLLQDIDTLKQKITATNLEEFNENITNLDLLQFLHSQGQTMIKVCEIDLFIYSITNTMESKQVSKLALLKCVGIKQKQQHERQIESDGDDNQMVLIPRILTMIIQLQSLLEQKRQQFRKLGIRFDEVFQWLDLDRDGLVTEVDFLARFPNQHLCFKYLLAKFGRSLSKSGFYELFQPKSVAKFE